jgi:hypothetical protein
MRNGEYEFAVPHFFEEMVNDDLIFGDVEAAIANGRLRAASPLIHGARDLRLLDRQATNATLPSFVVSRRLDDFS